MADPDAEHILLIGDDGAGRVRTAVASVLPGATVVTADSVFDGIAALSADAGRPAAGRFTTVLAAAEPIERRPEAAVRVLRGLAGDGRLVLFGHSTLELLSRKMMRFGCDDYLVTPASPGEVRQVFETPGRRRAAAMPARPPETAPALVPDVPTSPTRSDETRDASRDRQGAVSQDGPLPDGRGLRHGASERGRATGVPTPSALPVDRDPMPDFGPPPGALAATAGPTSADVVDAGLLLDALLRHPHDPLGWALAQVNAKLAPAIELSYVPAGRDPNAVAGIDPRAVASLPVPAGDAAVPPAAGMDGAPVDSPAGALRAVARDPADHAAALAVLRRLAPLAGKALALRDRHAALQKMAITDDLTGVYNARYFRHFLQRILERARQMHFPVTLLTFDIDDFKGYNDRFGHQVGDAILKQTAAMMKRCVREHDLVARVGGDEFAVVFWDKEGPRQPRDPRHRGNPSRPPQSPVQVFERFKRMIRSDEFTALGHHGQGKLGISAGLAVYPYEAHDLESLIAEADAALMQGSKRNGKNQLSLVGNGTGTGNGFFPNGNGTPR